MFGRFAAPPWGQCTWLYKDEIRVTATKRAAQAEVVCACHGPHCMILLNSVDPFCLEIACLRLGPAPVWLKDFTKSKNEWRHLSRRASSPHTNSSGREASTLNTCAERAERLTMSS